MNNSLVVANTSSTNLVSYDFFQNDVYLVFLII